MKKIRIVVLVLLLISLISYFVYQEGSLAVDKSNQGTVVFVINKGEGLYSITKRLSSEQLIRNKLVFLLIAKQMGIEKKIQAGDFRLSKKMSANEIGQELTHGTVDEWITIVEGLRKEEVAQQLSEQFSINQISFIEQAKEGRVFPDTYLIPKSATIASMNQLFETTFQKKFAEARNQYPFVKRSDREILVLASLIEREAKFSEDRRLIGSIILKRAENDWPLQLDATVQYSLGYQRADRTWWKRVLSTDDLKVDSTYNTYTHTGFPPAPICSPSLDSIKAAFAADSNTPYFYYVSDKKGKIHPAKTLEEHNANIKKYIDEG